MAVTVYNRLTNLILLEILCIFAMLALMARKLITFNKAGLIILGVLLLDLVVMFILNAFFELNLDAKLEKNRCK